MDKEIEKQLNLLVALIADRAPEDCTSCNIFINCQGTNVEYSRRTAESLKKDGISMRNLRGDFIR